MLLFRSLIYIFLYYLKYTNNNVHYVNILFIIEVCYYQNVRRNTVSIVSNVNCDLL